MIRFTGLGDSDVETILNGMEDYQTGILENVWIWQARGSSCYL